MSKRKYNIWLTVDNNRYGAYLKTFARRYMPNIEAESMKEAYYLAARCLQLSEKRYKNTQVRHYNNIGDHDFSSWSINFWKGEEVDAE